MTPFRINLIRHRPVPLLQRKSAAWTLLIYLSIAGLLLAWSINQAVWDVVVVRQQQRHAALERARLAQQHPRLRADVTSYIGSLHHQLADAAETLGIAEQLLGRQTQTAIILYELAAPLPRCIRLLSLETAPSDRALHFELAIPVESESSATNGIVPLTIWRNNPAIQRMLSNIREESSQQAEFDGRPSFLVRFVGTIKEGQ